MKLLLASVATFTMVGALAQAAFADTQQCSDASFPFLPVSFTCPSSGTLNGMRSVSTISAAAGRTLWTYRTDLQVGPAPFAQPRAAAALLTNAGAFAVSISGTLCPESVDNTVGNGPGTQKNCQTVPAADPGNPKKVRIFHVDL